MLFFIAFYESQVSSPEQLNYQKSVYISLSFAILNYFVLLLVIQFDASESKTIEIKSHPRSKFRPRTEKESQDSTHYILCEDYISEKYPTIYV